MGFQKREEDFVCEQCTVAVKGNGYTNHCPTCLWSKHVDTEPGDRAALCGGLMEPIRLEGMPGRFVLTHRCTRCGIEKKNKAASNDDPDALVMLSGKETQPIAAVSEDDILNT